LTTATVAVMCIGMYIPESSFAYSRSLQDTTVQLRAMFCSVLKRRMAFMQLWHSVRSASQNRMSHGTSGLRCGCAEMRDEELVWAARNLEVVDYHWREIW